MSRRLRLRLARASSRLPHDGGAGPEQNLRPTRTPPRILRTSVPPGNPAGYSRGRRISDAIEQRMDELQLDGKFADVAIAEEPER